MTLQPAQYTVFLGSGAVSIYRDDARGRTSVMVQWTSDASGDVRIHIDTPIAGVIQGVRTKPDGSAVPTDNYDVTWEDEMERDILGGNGANRSTNTVQEIHAAVVEVEGRTVFKVANAGNAKRGTAVLRLTDIADSSEG